MKTKSDLPTPSELAVFARERDIAVDDNLFFLLAVHEWKLWADSIQKASDRIGVIDPSAPDFRELIPKAEMMRWIGTNSEKTFRSWFESVRTHWPKMFKLEETFEYCSANGFPRWIELELRAERDRRCIDRAKKGGAAKAEKWSKRFKQRS